VGGCCGAVCCWRLLREPVSRTSFLMTIRVLTRVDTSSRSTRQRNRHSSLLDYHISRNDSTATATTAALMIDSQLGLGCSFLFSYFSSVGSSQHTSLDSFWWTWFAGNCEQGWFRVYMDASLSISNVQNPVRGPSSRQKRGIDQQWCFASQSCRTTSQAR
jgi:hypothetical protein